ncbi:PaaX family transcriptional regulator C-terminal domain-containing protein [Rhodococcus aerolatus]
MPAADPARVAPAAASRRRQLGSDSARSLLLTVLGEFVHPRREPVWTATLLSALAELGVEEKSARQAVARTAAEGLLVSEREGRRVRWSLTDAGGELLEQGTRRIYGFLRDVAEWDGGWLLLTVAIPETQRQLRHRVRTRLTWLGLGSPSPGFYVVPDARKRDEVAAIVVEAGLAEHAFAWVGARLSLGEQQRLIDDAWSLGDVAARYRDFTATFSGLTAADDAAAFAAQVRLVQAWRRFPFLDPALPVDLLPPAWPGPEAAAVFHRRHDEWHAAAQRWWTAAGS